MKQSLFCLTFGLALVTACTGTQGHAKALKPVSCDSNITAYGSRAALKIDPGSVATTLARVPVPKTAIGYGPADGYNAELTMVDGNWFVAHATGADSVRVETTPKVGTGAVFFVSAAPMEWSARRIDKTITAMAGLETLLADAAAEAGCSKSAIPFQLTGTISAADWSVVGRPVGAKGQLSTGPVTLIGIYAPIDPDRYFMPTETNLHVHFVTEDGTLSGHLSSFQTLEDGILRLPSGS